MIKMKKWVLVALVIMLTFCLTACQESNESKYNRAGKLLTEGKYDEAVKLFDEISTYEDASKMAMYGKAIAAAESGDYKSAFSSFQALGDYKDCPMMITYYTARQYEGQATDVNWSPRIMAAETYDTIALFLDSKERAENNRKTVYDSAVHLAELQQYSESMEMLSALRDYEDSALLRRYYEAFNLEQEDKFTEASRAFAGLEDYKDSKDQAVEVLKRGYQEADGQERLGKQEEAYRIFMNLAECEYEDSFERANKPYYDLGMSLRAEKKWPDAIAAFEHAGKYSDAETQVKETKYMQAFDKREQHNWDAAIEIFTALGDYKDSTTVQINETNYQRADALEKEGKQEEAYKLFISLGRYGDSFTRANKPYYDLGITKREAGEWDEAVAAFEHAGTYEDAPKQIKATRYAEGEAKREAQDWDGACEAFIAVGKYKDAEAQILVTRYAEGEAKQAAQDWDGAIIAFEQAGDYEDAADQIKETIYLKAHFLLELGDYEASCVEYCLIRGYKDVDTILRTNANLFEVLISPYREIGRVVVFGQYVQDFYSASSEAIEWIVLDYDDKEHKALLLSRYGLDAKPYNDEDTSVNWEQCTIRNWLNGEFLQTVFSAEERKAILTTEVDNGVLQGYSKWHGEGGNNTQDQMFLLSYAEANRYFKVAENISLNTKARVAPTSYAIRMGAMTDTYSRTTNDEEAGWWWLRSPGNFQNKAAMVNANGSLIDGSVIYNWCVVRPAFWLNLESDF